ncbi:MAG: hypothetical protein IPK71_24270 [Myxococcales bacterium]|nr:hypothetical protein [Myxococcales bacterium]
MTPIDVDLLVSPGHAGFLASPVLVVVLGLLVPGLGLVVSAGRALQAIAWKRRAQRAGELEVGSLEAGPAVIAGEVSVDDTDAPQPGVAVRLTIRQVVSGAEAREVSRRLDAGPFYVTTRGGDVVRVEPGAAPVLATGLSTLPGGPERFRVASLSAGEHAICAGELLRGFNPRAAQGYRASEGGWVLRPPKGARMWVSGARLGEVFASRATVELVRAAVFAFGLVLAQLLFAPFYRMALWGEPATCTLERTVSYNEGPERRITAYGSCDDGSTLSVEVRPRLEELVASHDTVRVVRLRAQGPIWAGAPRVSLGPTPSVSWVRVAALLGSLGIAWALVYAFVGRVGRAHYERKRLDERIGVLEPGS